MLPDAMPLYRHVKQPELPVHNLPADQYKGLPQVVRSLNVLHMGHGWPSKDPSSKQMVLQLLEHQNSLHDPVKQVICICGRE